MTPLSELLSYRAFCPAKKLFYGTHSHGFILEMAPLVGCTEAMQREISGLFQHTLPEGASAQFMLWADPRVGDILESWGQARGADIFHDLASKRTSFLEQRTFEPDHPLRNFRCIVSVSASGDTLGPVEEKNFLQLKDHVTGLFKNLGMPLYLWHADDLLDTLDGILGFRQETQPSNLKWNPYDPLHEQLSCRGAWHVSPSGITLNEDQGLIRNYSIRREPDLCSLHAMGELIGDTLRDNLQIPCPFIIHYGVHIPTQEKTRTRVQSRESWVENQARSKIGKRIPILMNQARELDFVRQQQAKGERFVQTSLSVALLTSPDHMPLAEQSLLSLFRSKQWQLQANSYIHLPTFLSMLPLAWGEGLHQDLFYLQKLKTTLSTESANLLPLQGEWKGTSSKGMLLSGRRGQLLTWSPFDNDQGNYNVAVVGKSGSGKSVFMQELVTSTLGQGGQVFVLDVGRSFERTAKLLGGTFLEFTAQAPLSINPFSAIPEGKGAETDDALSMLKPILSLMAAPRDGMNDLEYALIEQTLKAVWEERQNSAEISDIADFLKQHTDPMAHNLGQKLFPYTRDGIYGRFFEGPAKIDLSNPMVVVELEELKERKDLQEVIVQMMIVQITNKLYLGDRTTPSHVVLDEAWDMLRAPQSGIFIETAARRLRKYRGSLVVGTQSVNDFYATPAAQVAFENCDWMCLLSQKQESIKQLKASKRIHMDPSMETMLGSLKTKQGKYAEILIYGPHGYAVTRLILDPFSQSLYSTSPEVFAAIQQKIDEGMTLTQAIEAVS